jgi:hypothetical protein
MHSKNVTFKGQTKPLSIDLEEAQQRRLRLAKSLQVQHYCFVATTNMKVRRLNHRLGCLLSIALTTMTDVERPEVK